MSTVLIIEDDLACRELLVFLASQLGHTTVTAIDGEDGVSAARTLAATGALDLVLCDVRMPRLDGYGVLAALRQDAAIRDVPFMLVTGSCSHDDVPRGLDAGAHDYLQKPLEPREFLARVTAALRVKALQDELKLHNVALDRMARIDPLTGLFNRRHMEERLAELVGGIARYGHELSVLMVDIDHFKRVNDACGHPAGDAVLVEVARRIRMGLRAEDVPGRWGGEEFLLLLPFVTASGAEAVAERLRAAISATPITVGANRLDVTVSVGGASVDDDRDPIHAADEALYAAKDAGRDTVRFAARCGPTRVPTHA